VQLPPHYYYTGAPFRVTFDHNVTATGADPNAKIRVHKDGFLWQTFTNSHSHIIINHNYVSLPIWWGDNVHISISIDENFVKGADSHLTPAYFLGTVGYDLQFDVLPNPVSVGGQLIYSFSSNLSYSNNFTLALDGDLDMFTPENFCAALGLIIWSIPCDKVTYTVGYYLPIVAFQFVNMASGTAQIAEARLLENVATGRLSDVLAAQGMGPIIPGTFVHITSDVDPMRDVSVTLSPPDVNEPTTVRFTATVPHGLPTGGKVEVILPSDFSITASDLVVEVVNHTSLYAYRQAYSAPQVVVGGSSPTGIMIDTAAMPLDMPLGPNTMLVVRIPKGVANPPTCLNAAKWVWTVKTYSAQSTLLDFTVANPATDLCVGAPVRVGVPDPAFLKTAHWLNVRPTMSVVYETIKVYFYGFRFTLAPDTIYVKLAALSDGTCTGLAPGSAIATLDAEAAATFMVTDEGLYDICIQHRTNWEPVANTKFDVRAQILGQPQVYGTPTLFGYNTCESMLKVRPTACGCYYTDGRPVQNHDFTLPTNIPLEDVLELTKQHTIAQGCCNALETAREAWAVPDKSFLLWGVCYKRTTL